MIPAVEIAGARVFLGDCRDVLRTLPDSSVDSVVTDPPYELGFMGKKWDSSGVAYDVTVWQECLRVLKPGGHILAFGGSRTWHRLAVAVEDAGFELRDSIAWIYGSGFPKSLDVSKAIDKKAGVERKKVPASGGLHKNGNMNDDNWSKIGDENPVMDSSEAITSEAKEWQGWGTALKPAFEPVVVGRKPLVGTVAENVLLWGVGGLNIDGSRIAGWWKPVPPSEKGGKSGGIMGKPVAGKGGEAHVQGRWPANVILDEVSAGLLDEQSGVSRDGVAVRRNGNSGAGMFPVKIADDSADSGYGGRGGASRFFYVAKASKRDRNEGLEELEARAKVFNGQSDKPAGNAAGSVEDKFSTQPAKNFHPTVKPTQLMRYLIKLVTPEGGVVLDPFTGSGSTGKAALLDGYQFIGAELTEEYLPIIEGRLRWAAEQEGEDDGKLF